MREKNKKYCTSKTIIVFHIWVLLNSIIFAQSYGGWTEIDSLNTARVGHAMVVLPNGNVLVSGNDVDSIQSSCEIFNIATGKWRYTTPMNVPRTRHNLVLLSTGKVLAIGGLFERSCEVFDPQTETWTMTDSMISHRNWGGFTMTTLIDNRINVVGGLTQESIGSPFVFLNKCEIYDPLTGQWTETTSMNLGRAEHTTTLLDDGRILVTGGSTENLHTDQCEIYDPVHNTWGITSSMIEKRNFHAAILLNNGNVFISGGNPTAPWLKSCEVYDVNTNQWNSVSDMFDLRSSHQIYYMSKIDKLLILGGAIPSVGTEDSWEIYDPDTFQPLHLESFPINQFLVGNNVQLLNEKIMVAGGEEYDFNPMPYSWPSKRCWIYDATTEVAQDNNAGVENFFLSQNYPNPFNPVTTISYTLEKPAKVELVVYDVLGREAAVLVEAYQISGIYKVEFSAIGRSASGGDAMALSSGVYYYRLTVSVVKQGFEKTFQEIKKMVLIR